MAWAADARWLGLLAEYLVKTTAVLFLALVAASLMRRRSAALRHFVLSAFLVGLVLLPLLPSLPTGWETRWLPARPVVKDAARAIPTSGAAYMVGVPLKVTEPLIIAESAQAAEHFSGRSTVGITLASRVAEATTRPGTTEDAPAARVRVAAIIERTLPLAWSAGLLILLLRLGLGLAGAARLSREGRPLDDSVWEALLRRFLTLVTLRRHIRLKSHGRVAIPMTWGLVRPVILFPEDSRDWDEGRRSAALFHELSHIKRADFAVMLLVRLSLALFWFNPLVWAVFRRLRREQEKACDELVLRAGIKPSSYARSLLMFRRAADGAWGPSAALLGLATGSSLDERLAAILRQKMTIKEITMKTRIALTIAIFAVVTLVGSARPAAQAAPAPTATASLAEAPSPVQEAAAVSQEKQATQKEKEAAQAEKRAKETPAKTIVITTSEAKKGQLQITITEGDETKTWVLDHPLIIEGAGTGKDITVKVDGKDYIIPQGERLSLLFGRGTGKVIKESEAGKLMVGVPGVIKLDTPGHHGTVIKVVTPEGVIVKEVPGTLVIKEAPEPAIVKEVVINPVVVAVPAPAAVPAVPAVPGVPAAPAPAAQAAPAGQAAPAAPAKITTYQVLSDGKAYTVSLSPRQPQPPYPQAVTYSVVPAYGVDVSRKEIRGELQAIQEQVRKLEQRRPDVTNDLKAIEESLQALTEKLEKAAAKLDAYKVTTGVPVEHLTVGVPAEHITVVGKDGTVGETYGVAYSDTSEKAHVLRVVRSEADGFTVIYRTGEVLKDDAAVDRALDKVKEALPQGYGLESKVDKESGTLTLKITSPQGKMDDEGLVKKIVVILVEELKKDTAGKN